MEEITQGRLINVDIEQEMKKSYLEYSMSVIVGRALPDVRDGLKPVHRRILYTMYEANNTPDRAYRKCAYTVGEVLGRFHPHGDASVYDALVRLAQSFSMRAPLVDGHGNFGSVDGDPAAAYRYTEARMSKVSLNLLTDIEKQTVDFVPNYDDNLMEPSVLPSRYPNLLVNGSIGIAVGMATNIPPHNMGEVIKAVCTLIDNPDCSLEDLMQSLPGPDFPTGGVIMGRSGIRAAYATGRGRVVVRGKHHIEEMPHNREKIVITEIPYGVNKARLIEAMADLVKDKRVDMISDLRDESDRDGMRIVIELKRDANSALVLNQLYTYTQLQDTCGVIMLALANGIPKVMSLKEVLEHYVKFQKEIIVRRTIFDLRKAEERAHILEGLKRAIDIVDEIIATIRGTKGGVSEAKAAIMEKFDFDDLQAAAIVAFRLGQLAGLEIEKITNELNELAGKIAQWKALLADDGMILALIKSEIIAIGDKFSTPRKTEIQTVSGEVDIEDLIPEEDCIITLTHHGYIKRQTVDTYKTQRRGGRGVTGMTQKEEDFVTELFLCSTHDYIMFFTSAGKCYRMKGYEVAESSRTSKGTNIINLIPLENGEKVTSAIKVGAFDGENYVCMVTRQGIIKRTALSAFKNIRKGGLIAVNLDDGDELAWVVMTNGEDDLIIGTKGGRAIRFNETETRGLSRGARGVRAIRLEEGDVVVGMAIVTDDSTLLTVSENGAGRRTPVKDYPMRSRGGKGVLNYYVDKNGPVAAIRAVGEKDDVFVISDDGVIIRTGSDQISAQSRYGGGVRVMRLAEGSKIVTIATAPAEEEVEEVIVEEGAENTASEPITATENIVETEIVTVEAPETEE